MLSVIFRPFTFLLEVLLGLVVRAPIPASGVLYGTTVSGDVFDTLPLIVPVKGTKVQLDTTYPGFKVVDIDRDNEIVYIEEVSTGGVFDISLELFHFLFMESPSQ